MKKLFSFNIHKYLQLNVKTGIAVSLILWIYLIFRAYYVPLSHDEIATFWFHINTGDYIPFTFKLENGAANNHVLNSLLTRFIYLIFGNTPIVLRLANLLFIPIYCLYSYKISDTLKNKHLALLLWFCFLFIHSIVEFLALSRGYGMSFALLLGCLWYLIRTMQSGKAIHYFLSLLFLTGSVSANLSLMASALMIIVLLIINIIIINEKINYKIFRLFIVFVTGLLPVGFFAVYSFALQKAGALYYGQHDSFWGQSVNTLLKALFDDQSQFLRLLIFAYFILILILFAKYLSKHLSFTIFRQPVLIFPLLLTGNIIAVLLLNYLFNVNFPEDRTGFYFYYFFIGSVFYLLDESVEIFNYRKTAWIAIPFLLIPAHFIYISNLTHIIVYREDRVPNRFYEKIRKKAESMPEVATLGSYKQRILVLAYQNYLNNGNVGISHVTDYPSLVPDFLVVNTFHLATLNLYYNSIDYDKVSEYHLLERKHKLQRQIISEVKAISTNGYISNEYFNLVQGAIDTLIQNPLFFEYDMDIESTAEPFVAWIVVGVSDSANNTTAYERIPLNWIKPAWKGKSKHYHNGQLITNLPATSKIFITYIWNINKVPFSISNAKVTIKQLELSKGEIEK